MHGLPRAFYSDWRSRAFWKGGGGSAPPAPDPAATAAAQTASNTATAQTQSVFNHPNVTTPYGTQNWTQPGGVGAQWYGTTTLSPGQQAISDSQERAQQGLFGLANQAIPKVGAALDTPLNFEGLPDPQAQGQNIAQSAKDVGQELYETGRNRLAPDFSKQIEEMRQDLANRGIPIGSDAYGQSQRQVYGSQDDTLASLHANAQAQSTNQLQTQTALAQALRQQGIQERSLLRSQPIDDVTRLMGLSGGPSVPQFQQIQPSQVSPTDTFGATNLAYQSQLQNWQNRNTQANSFNGGLFGLVGNLGAAGIRAWAGS